MTLDSPQPMLVGAPSGGKTDGRRLPPIENRPLLSTPQSTQSSGVDGWYQKLEAIFQSYDPQGRGVIEKRKIDAIFGKLKSVSALGSLFGDTEALEQFSTQSGEFEYRKFLSWLFDGDTGPQEEDTEPLPPPSEDPPPDERPEAEYERAPGSDDERVVVPEAGSPSWPSRQPPAATTGTAAEEAVAGADEVKVDQMSPVVPTDSSTNGANRKAPPALDQETVQGDVLGKHVGADDTDGDAAKAPGGGNDKQQEQDPKLSPNELAAQEQKALVAAAIVLLLWAVLLVTLTRLKRQFPEPECLAEFAEGHEPLACEPCSTALNFLPMFGEYEQSWPPPLRATLYLVGLLWIFQGVGEVCNEFMTAIEAITQAEREVLRPLDAENKTFKKFKVKVWNGTVANLTLMALGSSAPEILLSVIEVIGGGFKIGKLGASTIVGSAAFNLFVISAACVSALEPNKVKKIGQPEVFAVTSMFSLFAYFWLLVMLQYWTPQEVTLEEALFTFALFPAIIVTAYAADRASVGKLPSWLSSLRRGHAPVTPLARSPTFSNSSLGDCQLEGITLDHKIPAETFKAIQQEVRERDRSGSKGTPHSRSSFRRHATSALAGSSSTPLSMVDEKELSFCFERSEVRVLECEGLVKLKVVASRRPRTEVSIRWTTEDGSAKCSPSDGTPARYEQASGELVFRHDDASLSREIEVMVIDDDQWEPTEFFRVTLENPMTVPGAHSGHRDVPRDSPQLGTPDKCKVYILNDDRPGFLSWDFGEVCTYPSNANNVTLYLSRRGGNSGEVTVDVNVSVAGKAASSSWKSGPTQSVHFPNGVSRKDVKVDLKQLSHDPKIFQVELANASPPVCLRPSADDYDEDWCKKQPLITSCQVEVLPPPKAFFARRWQRSDESQPKEESPWEEWKMHFASAIYCKGSPDEQKEATFMDFLKHSLSLPWKVLFAFVPPASMCGGWLAFFVALLMIGVLTAVVGDMATLLGCVVDIPDEITAITLVAMGTSLPDTIASVIAAQTLDTCDDAIGNITGSNSVNVFLGLGIPWTIAAAYWHIEGEKFEVPAGSLSFSVMVFTGCAVLCIFVLLLRRKAYGGELGGSKCTTRRDSVVLFSLWLVYLTGSILKSYELI